MKWVRFSFFMALAILGGFGALPTLVGQFNNPVSFTWSLIVGGVFAVYVICNEIKKLG